MPARQRSPQNQQPTNTGAKGRAAHHFHFLSFYGSGMAAYRWEVEAKRRTVRVFMTNCRLSVKFVGLMLGCKNLPLKHVTGLVRSHGLK